MKNTSAHYNLVMTSMFVAIIFVLAFTPIGFIQLGLIKATIVHIPVILGSIRLGPKRGALLGGAFGLTSLISNTFTPVLLSFAFSPFIPVPGTQNGSLLALLVCFVPRIVVGIVPYYVYTLVQRVLKNSQRFNWLSLAAAAIIGSMTNTLLVLNLMYLLFQDAYATAKNIPAETVYAAVMTIVAVNGVPEALVSGVIITALGKVLLKFQRQAQA